MPGYAGTVTGRGPRSCQSVGLRGFYPPEASGVRSVSWRLGVDEGPSLENEMWDIATMLWDAAVTTVLSRCMFMVEISIETREGAPMTQSLEAV